MQPQSIKIADYTYELPHHRIAKYPLENRSESKLLVYKNGQICEDSFYNICQYIPKNATLILNESKVIPARLYMTSETGKAHEVFCLEAVKNEEQKTIWKCMARGIGKKQHHEFVIDFNEICLKGKVVEKIDNYYLFEFYWQPENLSFVEVLARVGEMPIPPYLKRESEESDKVRYQTVYAKNEGSVAAPTAGLHFTEQVFTELAEKGVKTERVTLHVGAGTFQPVKSETMEGHPMHEEWIDVKIESLTNLIKTIEAGNSVISVGTTSLRTIESVYWMGVKSIQNPDATNVSDLAIKQWDVYDLPQNISVKESLTALIAWMKNQEISHLFCKTQLLIVPTYNLKVAQAIVTNFHQPNSTLLLLVASILKENWRTVYNYALDNEFRFLSYGDSSLLFKGAQNQ